MTARPSHHGFSLRLRVFLLFAALAASVLAALVLALVWGASKAQGPTGEGFVIAGIAAGFTITGLIAALWVVVDRHIATPIERIAGALRAHAHTPITAALDPDQAIYLGDLGPAAVAITAQLGAAQGAVAQAVAGETRAISGQKARLEALLSDVPVGVLLCTADHKLAFYNGQAVDLLGGMDAAGQGPALDRRLFDYLHAPPIRHAYARLIEAQSFEGASDLLCTARIGGRVLAARMRLLSAQGAAAAQGYVLTLRDISADLAAHSARERLMDEMFDRIRRPAAAIQSLVGLLAEEGGPAGPARDKIRAAAQAEAGQLAGAIHDLAAKREALRDEGGANPMVVRASDLAEAVRARVAGQGGDVMAVAAPLMLRGDGFALAALLSALIGHLRAQDAERTGFRLEIAEEGAGAMLALEWEGSCPSLSDLEGWLDLPLEAGQLGEIGQEGGTGRRVLAAQGTEIWPERISAQSFGFGPAGPARGRICLPLRHARHAVRPVPEVPRRAVYDFDLLEKTGGAELAECRLEDLTFVVFDTETTGLLPERGDEICQIAAVRIVNGRRVEGEVFDTLVNPARPIPLASTKVHGITDAMVKDAPQIAQAGAQFHAFAQGAVLVAHNAPFDLAFLRRKAVEIGVNFDHPVLDTVLLSAVVFGQSEVHSLDALTHRLGITIPQEARHTALGDTVATAEAFLKMLPALRARGLETFGELIAELRKHGRLLKDLNG